MFTDDNVTLNSMLVTFLPIKGLNFIERVDQREHFDKELTWMKMVSELVLRSIFHKRMGW